MSSNKQVDPGSFLVIGRRDDTNEIVISSFNDIPLSPKVSQLCRRVLMEMGLRGPLVYEFIALVYARRQGGAAIVLDQTMLRRFVYANWGRSKR